MESVKIAIEIPRDVAIANSCSKFGRTEYAPTDDELRQLTSEQRRALATYLDSQYGMKFQAKTSPISWPDVISLLEELANAEAKKRNAVDLLNAEARAAIATPEPSSILELNSWGWRVRLHESDRIDHPLGGNCDSNGRYVRASCSLESDLQAEANRRNGEFKAARRAEFDKLTDEQLAALKDPDIHELSPDAASRRRRAIAAIEEAKEALEQAKKDRETAEIRAALVAGGAPEHVLERLDDGCLPDTERNEYLRNAVFRSIELTPFRKLEDSDLDHDNECDCAEPKYKHSDYDGELDAEEWILWKAAKAAIESAGFEAVLRITKLSCENCEASTYRLKARATTTVGGLTVWKEYAVE